MRLSKLDKQILHKVQQGVCLVRDPWQKIAAELGISADLLLSRLRILKKNGVIRRVGATFSSRKMGFVSTLAAAKIAPEDIDSVAAKISGYSEVTHNYRRRGEYNLWWTIVARDKKRISRIISCIKKDKRVISLLDLPVLKMFKLGVVFDF